MKSVGWGGGRGEREGGAGLRGKFRRRCYRKVRVGVDGGHALVLVRRIEIPRRYAEARSEAAGNLRPEYFPATVSHN